MKLSVIITASNEGILAHKTMLSVLRALAGMEDYEIIIHIDNGTEETRGYFARYKKQQNYQILENTFGDLGKSRNFAISKANGDIVCFLDADDLVSENYFRKMLEVIVNSDEDVVVHPEYCLSFDDLGEHCSLQKMSESFGDAQDAFFLFGRNRWISSLGGKRKTFLAYPYKTTDKGFGHEDYDLNIRLTEAGVKHRVAQDTVHFYRRKVNSLLKSNLDNRVTQPYNEIFAIEAWKKMTPPQKPQHQATNESLKQRARDYYVRLRNNKTVNAVLTPIASLAKKVTGKKLVNTDIPEVVLSEWKKISEIELQLFPTPFLQNSLSWYTTEGFSEVGNAYYELCQQIGELPDYVFVVPWVVAGGSDKVMINYLRAIKEIHPNWHVAVITTLDSKNEWQKLMPNNSYLVNFGGTSCGLTEDDKEILFTRLLIQLKTKRLHIINSDFAYDWVRNHQELVKNNFKLYCSVFCHSIIPGTDSKGIWDFADPKMARIYHLIDKVFTDNSPVVKRLVKQCGFSEDKFTVLPQPTSSTEQNPRNHEDLRTRKMRILWAGRIASQKNPALLVRIARALDPEKFQIDVFGRFDAKESEGFRFPRDVPTLVYHGEFDGFQSLDLSEYDLLLYTSYIDGMPNIILEAAAAGMIAVASGVGGISDFVKNDKTGFLIKEADDEKAYVAVLEKIKANPEVLPELEKNAKDLLKKKYAWDAYMERMRKEF